METLFWSVKSSRPRYTVRLVCEKTGAEATISIPVDMAEKEALINRVSQAMGSMDTIRFEVGEEKV